MKLLNESQLRELLARRQPDFSNFAAVLKKGRPSRPVLFEMHNVSLAVPIMGDLWLPDSEPQAGQRNFINGHRWCGYDFAMTPSWEYRLLSFPTGKRHADATVSLNEGALITDRASFEAYPWPKVEEGEYARIAELAPFVPDGMKLVQRSPGGIFETLVNLVGYENLCLTLMDDPDLVQAILDEIGPRFVRHFDLSMQHECMGAGFHSDDWGFKTQTLISPEQLRQLIIPWHRKVVQAIHGHGKLAILHSCGKVDSVFDDIIDMGYDGKHSYEDEIVPVEQAYDRWAGRIAILGGIDLDFLARRTPAEVYQRSKAMLQRSAGKGCYALGSGNSIPEYIPPANYFAMIQPALET